MKRNVLIFIKKSILLALILIFCNQSNVFAQNQFKGIVRDSNNVIVKSADTVNIGDELRIKFADGDIVTRVEED